MSNSDKTAEYAALDYVLRARITQYTMCIHVQWNPSKTDSDGPNCTVLYSEVSLRSFLCVVSNNDFNAKSLATTFFNIIQWEAMKSKVLI